MPVRDRDVGHRCSRLCSVWSGCRMFCRGPCTRCVCRLCRVEHFTRTGLLSAGIWARVRLRIQVKVEGERLLCKSI